MKTKKTIKVLPLFVAVGLASISCSSLINLGHASAVGAPMNQTLVRLDRLALSANTGGRVCAKPTTTATEASVAVTFPTNAATDYALSATLASWAATGVADANLSAIAWPGLSATSATSVVGKTVTWTSSDLTVGQMYCFQFAGGLTNANNNTENVAGNVSTFTSTSTAIDTGYFSDGLASPAAIGDQVAITGGTVPPIFTFSLSGNTDAFTSNLGLSGPVATSGRNVSVATNAANGYMIWAKDTWNGGAGNGALKSATANFFLVGTAAVGTAARTIANGSQDYGMSVSVTTNGSGTTIPNAAYNSGGTGKVGTLDPVNYQQLSSATTATAADVVNVTERASMSTTTKSASDYADTITIVGAGLF